MPRKRTKAEIAEDRAIGRRLRAYRNAKRRTQESMLQCLGFKWLKPYQDLEAGRSHMTIIQAHLLAEELDIKPGQLRQMDGLGPDDYEPAPEPKPPKQRRAKPQGEQHAKDNAARSLRR